MGLFGLLKKRKQKKRLNEELAKLEESTAHNISHDSRGQIDSLVKKLDELHTKYHWYPALRAIVDEHKEHLGERLKTPLLKEINDLIKTNQTTQNMLLELNQCISKNQQKQLEGLSKALEGRAQLVQEIIEIHEDLLHKITTSSLDRLSHVLKEYQSKSERTYYLHQASMQAPYEPHATNQLVQGAIEHILDVDLDGLAQEACANVVNKTTQHDPNALLEQTREKLNRELSRKIFERSQQMRDAIKGHHNQASFDEQIEQMVEQKTQRHHSWLVEGHYDEIIREKVVSAVQQKKLFEAYEKNDQATIAAVSKGRKIECLYGDDLQDREFVHSVGMGPIGHDKSWSSTGGKGGLGPNGGAVSVETYVERIQDILKDGLRPSKRAHRTSWERLTARAIQTIWLYDEQEQKKAESLYGIALVVVAVKDYAVFPWRTDSSRNNIREYYIISNESIPVKQHLILKKPVKRTYRVDKQAIPAQAYFDTLCDVLKQKKIKYEIKN